MKSSSFLSNGLNRRLWRLYEKFPVEIASPNFVHSASSNQSKSTGRFEGSHGQAYSLGLSLGALRIGSPGASELESVATGWRMFWHSKMPTALPFGACSSPHHLKQRAEFWSARFGTEDRPRQSSKCPD
jgi:hypothetical protein